MPVYDSMIVDKPKFISAVCAFLGLILLAAAVYLFINRIMFLAHGTSASEPIVAVSHEWVPAGRGSVLAYVPTVQVRGRDGTTRDVKVATFNEKPIYTIGQQITVSCNPAIGCIEDTLLAKWGAFIFDLLLSFVFFSPLIAWKTGLWQPNDDITGLNLQRDREKGLQ